jgi:type I restriction enzyme M protein
VEENGAGAEETPAEEGNRAATAEEKLNDLKSALVTTTQKLMDLESEAEALAKLHEQEIAAIAEHWAGTRSDLNAQLKAAKAGHKAALTALNETQKKSQKAFSADIKALEKRIPEAEREMKALTHRGKLELILTDEGLISRLNERWIAAEVAKRLDYPIFMAVSERGGKDNSGDYEYVVDAAGSLVEFPDGHSQAGQLVVDQDLVNYDLQPEDLAAANKIPHDKLCVAEAFVSFAQQHKLSFWERK